MMTVSRLCVDGFFIVISSMSGWDVNRF